MATGSGGNEGFRILAEQVVSCKGGSGMSKLIDVKDLPARLDEALASAAAGDEVIVTDGTNPRARLVPLPPPGGRVAGLHPGAYQIAPDFDDPLPDEFWTGP